MDFITALVSMLIMLAISALVLGLPCYGIGFAAGGLLVIIAVTLIDRADIR